MSRKLTKEEESILDNIYKDTDLKGRALLRQFIIRNTYEPKYKIGDCINVSVDKGEYIYGKLIQNVKMKIEEVNYWFSKKGEEVVQYCGYAIEKDTNKKFFIAVEESIHGKYTERHVNGPADDNINVFQKKSNIAQSCDVDIL